ncbi:thiamin pyrophosphokinase 1 isoform X2 [Diachasma alloeum]|uniref:thiamin pyrophosphokinase 1 isoform X2 n=1 Tax=Diachasma alloeum TaxID=454923 RepID=UPI000738123C|nr:thiamin pyrophosphokinase 1 isoform X2 [Diachasma alloeum]
MSVTERIPETLWNPVEIFQEPRQIEYAVLILNRPIPISKHLMLPIWKEAKIKITVDGGTHRWLQYLDPLAEEVLKGKHPELVPTLITGDFDSVLPESLDKFRNLGVSVIETPDQNYTDFSKALMQLAAACENRNTSIDSVYTFHDNGGRFDHTIANINTLYISHELMGDKHVDRIILVSSNSLTWLLRAGRHRIKIPAVLQGNNSWIGLIPFGCTANVSTTGLKWNLTFGRMVSTSNTYDGSPEVTVNTDSDIIWTMGIKLLLEMTNGCI